MALVYVATSKGLQEWGADVGLGKHLYKVGLAEEGTAQDAVAGLAGWDDWKVLLTVESEQDDQSLLDRLAVKEKLVDPNYYPRLRGTKGVVKVTLSAVENSMLVAIALDNREAPKNFKVKPVDIAQYLVRNLTKSA